MTFYRLLRPALLATLLAWQSAAPAIDRAASVQPPSIAPAWSLKTPEGRTVNFPQDAQGRPSVLLFWPSWCPYSRALQPYVQDIWNDYKNVGVNVWTINILEKGDPVQVMRDRGLSFPLLLNGDALRATYVITRTPWLVVIDGQNRIVYTRPPNDAPSPIEVAKKTREALNQLLGDKAVPLPASYPPPYDLHLRGPKDSVDRRVPVKIADSVSSLWVSSYLASIPADEVAINVAASGALSRGSDAIAAAKKAWVSVYGADRLSAQAPYRAYRRDQRWVVLGDGLNPQLGQGLIAVFDAETGRCIRLADAATAP